MRSAIIAALVFLSCAPAALAQTTQLPDVITSANHAVNVKGWNEFFPNQPYPGDAVASDKINQILMSLQDCSNACSGKCVFDSAAGGAVCQPQTTGDAGSVVAPSGVGNAGTVQAPAPGQSITLINPLKSGTSLESFLNDILSFIIRIGAIVVVLMLVFVGYKFVAAQGAPGEIAEARKMLLWTVIGALVLLGAQAIASAIQATVTAIGG